jgi:hypothetical protein
MFVRFSQLTRAVDSASIAAAGQVRRIAPNQEELNETCNNPLITPETMYQFYDPFDEDSCVIQAQNLAFARSFANVGIAARQFVEFYGLSPRQVLVDMCATVSEVVDDELVAIEPELQEDFEQLCTRDQRKLIRVTAQIESPTIFLRLIGWQNILLQASSLSETAVLDIVLVMDVSESMANQTTYTDWADAGYPYIYMPPSANDPGGWSNYLRPIAAAYDARYGTPDGFSVFWQDLVQDNSTIPGNAQQEVNTLLETANRNNTTSSPFYYHQAHYAGYPTGTEPREACQVRFFPYSQSFRLPRKPNPDDPASDLRTFYNNVFSGVGGWRGNAFWGGFVPTYNYYGCCNDPNGDGSFGDLLCQPFREARDATERFLHRIDFFRGDRVAFVTYDRSASILYVNQDGGGDITHMIEGEAQAVATLQQNVGVRAEPTYYQPTEQRPFDGVTANVMPWIGPADTLGDHDYPVYSSCPFQDAVLPFPYSAVSSPNTTAVRYPNALHAGMYPRGAGWSTTGVTAYQSYDLWASCGGGNIGAALREANDALLRPRTSRTQGAVWIMVMISDGAAGVSDPVRNGGGFVVPDPIDYPYTREGFQVTYGGFGVCPAGDPPGSQGRPDLPDLVDFTETLNSFPFCSDELPETRHFCFNPAVNTPNEIDVRNGGFPDCEKNYDVDDYAHDWADFVTGIREIDTEASSGGLTQLPTIFTIGFGFNFDYGTTECSRGNINVGANPGESDLDDCLGEEILRYIADVGDNFTIDTDYQQWHRNGGPLDSDDDYGPRGPCEADLTTDRMSAATYEDLVRPLDAGQSCGNYFNAPDEEELDDVFDEIASRMFTRLTR